MSLMTEQMIGEEAIAGIPQASYMDRNKGRVYAIPFLLTVLFLLIVISVSIGSVEIPVATVYKVLISRLPFITVINPDWTIAFDTIVIDIRLPRVLLAGLTGAALAVAGATYQGLFRNPLADPYLIGVAQGASLGAVIGFLLSTGGVILGGGIIPLLAFTGAVISTAIVYSLARVGKKLPSTTLILAGVALGTLLQSIVSYLIISSGDRIHGILFWLMGSFSMSQWSDVLIVLPYISVGIIVILIYARPLNIMQLDEEQAQQLGINVESVKLILLTAATLITAAAVSFVGIIGFVGIIVPHAVRLIWGADHRFLLPLSVLTGAVFLILADMLARTVLAPTEIPIGVITALCGAPFFLYLLRYKRRMLF